jgi:uncharacterized protein
LIEQKGSKMNKQFWVQGLLCLIFIMLPAASVCLSKRRIKAGGDHGGRWLSLVLTLVTLLDARASAQESLERAPRPSIRVTGEATVTVKPDLARIDIGVVTQAQTAESAASQNAQQLDRILAELRTAIGSSASIQTIGYSLTPNYRYPKEGGKPTIASYTATNVLQVKTGELAAVGKLIDLATQSGSNNIHRLLFMLKDEQAVQSQALREAGVKAKARAESLAAALGLKILRVLSVTENEPVVVQPMREMMAAAPADSAAVPTPIEPGTIDVRATVVLTVEITQ